MKAQNPRKLDVQRLSHERRSGWILAGSIIAVLLGSLTYWFVLSNSSSRKSSQNGVSSGHSSPNSAQAARETPTPTASRQNNAVRPTYAYSLIPGGVRDVAELRAAMVKDSVIFAQYSTFRLEDARVIRLEQERRAHVAYRIGDRVYWTRREVKLEKGETVITDGVLTARTKCGNLVADDVEGRVLSNEPTEEALNMPVEPMQAPNELESDNRFPGLVPPPSATAAPTPNLETPPDDTPPSPSPWIGMGQPPKPGAPGSGFILPPPVPIPIGSGSGSPPPGPPNRPPTNPPTPPSTPTGPVPPTPPVPPVINTPEPGTAAQLLLVLPVILFLRRRWKTPQA